ncbi:MAG TPA: DnaJ C-terminal domain-containing protein, partial [Syntrophales bacterium]|nr:DnaJ C-terminal domain-containing protein [Syntrophales bacterium]
STPRLHLARPVPHREEAYLFDVINITPEEAERGVRKMISVPFGYQRKHLVVRIPPGIRDGTKLRLEGVGMKKDGGERGDLYLQVSVR